MAATTSCLLFFFWLCTLAVASTTLNGLQSTERSQRGCKTLWPRLEWRAMNTRQKDDYIRAIGCIRSKPALDSSNPAIRTRLDELQARHIELADSVHTVGQFLPWHRQLTIIHEKMLRDECQYRGPMTYWDWSKDADTLTQIQDSPVFDPVTGFGGDGVPNTYQLPENFLEPPSRVPINPYSWRGCVQDGAFAKYPISLGPGKLVTQHCLVRSINNTYSQYLTSHAVRNATRQPTFELFRIELEGRPITPTPKMHDSAHVLVGGDMGNFYSSVADPLFFLHHSNLDRIWWIWQRADPAKRLYQISGRSTVAPPYRNVTLDDLLNFGTFFPAVPIRQVMNIESEPSCYTYV